MRVLTFTRLYPNAVRPNHGVFVEERVRPVAEEPGVSLEVIAPVPWYPAGLPFPPRWAAMAQVPREEFRHGIRIQHPRYGVIPRIGSRLQGASLFASSLGRVRRAAPAVIDAHFLYPDGFAAVEIGARLGIPVVVTARGSDVNALSMPSWGAAARAVQGASMLIAVSEEIAGRLADLGAEARSIAVIPNGVDGATFAPVLPMARAAARVQLGAGRGDALLLSVGRLEPVKGHEVLLEAVAAIPARSLKLAIAGDGSRRRALEAQAERLGLGGRVRFLGDVPHDELPPLYSAADLFCLPSRAEGHPNALIEALACGTPAVASAVGAVPRMLREGAGFAVPPGDARALGMAVRAALARPWDAAAIRASVAHRSWRAVGRSVRKVLEEARSRSLRRSQAVAFLPREGV